MRGQWLILCPGLYKALCVAPQVPCWSIPYLPPASRALRQTSCTTGVFLIWWHSALGRNLVNLALPPQNSSALWDDSLSSIPVEVGSCLSRWGQASRPPAQSGVPPEKKGSSGAQGLVSGLDGLGWWEMEQHGTCDAALTALY